MRHPDITATEDDNNPNPYVTREMDGDIRSFQKDNNLTVDGRMVPGGETETAMSNILNTALSGTLIGNVLKNQRKAEKETNPIVFSTLPMRENKKPSGGIGFGGGIFGRSITALEAARISSISKTMITKRMIMAAAPIPMVTRN